MILNKLARRGVARPCVLALIAASAAFSAGASADNGIWRWKDAQGNLHYSDQPLNENAVDMGQKRALNPAAPQPAPVSRSRAASAPQAASAADPASAVVALTRENSEDVKRACDQSTAAVQQLSQGGRISSVDASGNRSILTDKQIADSLSQAKAAQTRWCATAPKN